MAMRQVQLRLQCSDWSSLEEDLLRRIISQENDDFKQRLAVMAVCRHWRYCCGSLDRLVIRSTLLDIPCKKHGGCSCSCLADSVVSVLNHSKSALKKLTLTTGEPINVLHRNWPVADGLDSLSLIFYDHWLIRPQLDDSGQLVHSKITSILNGQTRLRRFKLFFREESRGYSFNFLHVQHLRSLKKLHFLHVFNKLSELNSFIQMLPNLQVLEFRNSGIELDNEQVLRTSISVLRMRLELPNGADVRVDAPNLQELELYGFEGRIRTDVSHLHKLVLGAPVTVICTTAHSQLLLEELCITPAYYGDLATVRDTIRNFPCMKTLRLLLWEDTCDWEDDHDWEDADAMFSDCKQLQELEISDFLLTHLDKLVWTRTGSFTETFGLGDRLRTLTVTLLSDFENSRRLVDRAHCIQAIRAFKWDNNDYVGQVPQLAVRFRGLKSEVEEFLIGIGWETDRRLVVKKCWYRGWYDDLFEEAEMFEVDTDLFFSPRAPVDSD